MEKYNSSLRIMARILPIDASEKAIMLWQQFCDLDEEVQQAALPTGSEYTSRLIALKELVEKYQIVFLDNIPTGSDPPKAPRRIPANIKITTGEQVKGGSTIDTVIRQLQRRCNELVSSLNAPTVPQPYKQ